jgi:hypothetical protein
MVREALIEREAAEGFEIFVLSDTTNPEIYVKETAAYHVLREKLGDQLRVILAQGPQQPVFAKVSYVPYIPILHPSFSFLYPA